MEQQQLKNIIEAVLLAVGEPITINRLQQLFDEAERPEAKDIRETINIMQEEYADRGIELKELASGFCFQSKQAFSKWIARLWEERPPRYSRALLETLAIIAYRQPVTRAEIEDIRGVAVSSSIIKTLLEREWIKVIGQRDVPGKPSIYGTSKEFLDYFGLKSLEQLPTLEEIKDLEQMVKSLDGQLELEGLNNSPTDETEIMASSDDDHEEDDDDEPVDLDAVLEQAKQVEQFSADYQAEIEAHIEELDAPKAVRKEEAEVE